MTEQGNWNPFFVIYALSNRRSPDAQLARDTERWPDDPMTGFKDWIVDMIDHLDPETHATLQHNVFRAALALATCDDAGKMIPGNSGTGRTC